MRWLFVLATNRYGGQKLEELEIVEADDYIQVKYRERCETGALQ